MQAVNTKYKKEEKKIPNLRFPGFDGEWENNALGSIANISKGKGISKSDIAQNGELECIRYGELYTVYDEVIINIKSRTNLISEALVLSEKNDVIIPASGETQIDIATASCVLKTGVALGGDLNIIKAPVNGVFLSYYLNNKKKIDIAKLSQGISVVHLYSSQLKTLKLNLPETTEQNKIASFLTAVDQKIQQLTRKKELLELYKKGVMQKIFSQEIRFKPDNADFDSAQPAGGDQTGVVERNRVVERSRNYPDWEEKRLGEVSEYKNGKSFENDIIEDGTYNLVTLNSIDINGCLKNEHKKVNINDSSLNKNDLIMVLSDVAHGDFLGLTDIIPDNSYVLNQRMGALKPKIRLSSYFLSKYINHHQKYFKLHGQGSSQQNLSKGDILKFKIDWPIIQEQQKIASFLSTIDNKIKKIDTQLEKTQTFKKGLLQHMFV